jgi:hypothetical protein
MFRSHKRRKLDIVNVLTTVFPLFLGVLLIISIGWYKSYQNIPKENLIGNRDSNVSRLKEKGLPFSFLVIGDTHTSKRARILIEKALKEDRSSFMIILGDFVNKPDLWNHRFFITEMVKDIRPPFPVFLVPGNHDIDYSTKIKEEERRVTPQIYESLYGPRNFYFIFNDCLFIISGIDEKNPADYLNYLRDTLSKRAAGKRHIFIFMHHPPKGVGIPGSFSLPNEVDFFSLLETYKVMACFFGDFHGYWRGQRKGTNLIVSGGGGALKKWQPVWGKFHHMLKITVDEDKISEGMIILEGEGNDFSRTLEKWIFIQLFPVIGNRGWVLYALTILFLSLGIYSVIILFRRFLKSS